MFAFQAAVYGLGVCAEFGGSVFKPLVGGDYLSVLFEAVVVLPFILLIPMSGYLLQRLFQG